MYKYRLRFESQQLSSNNMKRLVPLLRRWIDDVETDPETVQRKTNLAIEQKRKRKKTRIDEETRSILDKQFFKNPNPTNDQLAVMARSFDVDKDTLKAWYLNKAISINTKLEPN